ncbi:hypothetical protein [Leptospira weilii]|nr:hypothetical protein [Leptospira weilii]MCL8267630.1 hypothetical protein [Leptospira weilii]
MKFKVSPEYECSPVWEYNESGTKNIDVMLLPISISLKKRIEQWDKIFQSTYNRDNPTESKFSTKMDEAHWDREGVEIYIALLKEIGVSHEVEYYRYIRSDELS